MKKLLFISLIIVFVGCENELATRLTIIEKRIETLKKVEQQHALLEWYYLTENRPASFAESYKLHPELFSADSIQFIQETIELIQHNEAQKQDLTEFYKRIQSKQILATTADLRDKIRQLRDSELTVLTNQQIQYRKIHKFLQRQSRANIEYVLKNAAPHTSAILTLQDNISQISKSFENSAHLINNSAIDPKLIDTYFQNTGMEKDVEFYYKSLLTNLYNENSFKNMPLPIDIMTTFLQSIGIRINRQSGLKTSLLHSKRLVSQSTALSVNGKKDIRLIISNEKNLQCYISVFKAVGKAEALLFNRDNIKSELQTIASEQFFLKLLTKPAFIEKFFNLSISESKLVSKKVSEYISFQYLIMSIASRDWGNRNNHLISFFLSHKFEISSNLLHFLCAELESKTAVIKTLQATETADKLLHSLEDKFGENWFESIEAGKYLKKYWANTDDSPKFD